MKINNIHPWDVDLDQARKIQFELQEKIILCPLKKSVKLIAGADVSYSKADDRYFAGVIVLKYPELTEVETASASGRVNFPYIPGFLSFREAPILLKAFEKLKTQPDVVMFDGQGIAHPRKLGIATHLGLFLDMPTIGCAKSRLIGNHEPIPENRGATVPLFLNEEIVGKLVRTRQHIKSVYVSPGFKITLDEAVDIVLNTSFKFRVPEPTRRAHIFVNQIRQKKIIA